MTPNIADAGSLNSLRTEYPAEEWKITRQLVRMIGSAQTWSDMVEASDALFQVQLRAKSMREEHARGKQQAAVMTAMGQASNQRSNANWDQ